MLLAIQNKRNELFINSALSDVYVTLRFRGEILDVNEELDDIRIGIIGGSSQPAFDTHPPIIIVPYLRKIYLVIDFLGHLMALLSLNELRPDRGCFIRPENHIVLVEFL